MNKNDRKFKSCLRDLENGQSEIVSLTVEIEKIQNHNKEIKVELRDNGLRKYNLERRNRIISGAKKVGYSSSAIENLERFNNECLWNQDNVTPETIFELVLMEEYNEKYCPQYKFNPLYKIGKFFNPDKKG